MDKVVISGCSYSSARNTSFRNFAFILLGDSIFQFDASNSEVQNGNIYTFPNYTFPTYISNGSFVCAIRIEDENFTSNATTLYDRPGNIYSLFLVLATQVVFSTLIGAFNNFCFEILI